MISVIILGILFVVVAPYAILGILFVVVAPYAMLVSAEFNRSFNKWKQEDKENKNESQK
jgi:uncharacterized membrane protein